ncbi:hypothetical protein [Bacillus salipaludis]|uniref:hypothetical protein n=1 Tax=Bacillus salipaludis TaxID=2547811 RepID=UPI002E2316CE|nr:hypothetical protein [Bacillus salipaludis]
MGKFDYIRLYFGKDADGEFLKDCKRSKVIDHAPDGYWICNANPEIPYLFVTIMESEVIE